MVAVLIVMVIVAIVVVVVVLVLFVVVVIVAAGLVVGSFGLCLSSLLPSASFRDFLFSTI